jgi:hypothetical protein
MFFAESSDSRFKKTHKRQHRTMMKKGHASRVGNWCVSPKRIEAEKLEVTSHTAESKVDKVSKFANNSKRNQARIHRPSYASVPKGTVSRYRGNFSTLSPDKEKRIQIYYIYVYIDISHIHIYTYI